MVGDVIDTSRAHLGATALHSVEDVRALGRPVIQFSDGLWRDLKEIRSFLFGRMYRAKSVMDMRAQVTGIVKDLFPLFLARPELLPDEWQRDVAEASGPTAIARIVSDYIAGMTDRYAMQTHERLIKQKNGIE